MTAEPATDIIAAGGAAVEIVIALERGGRLLHGPAGERADRLAELPRTADAVALPERHGSG